MNSNIMTLETLKQQTEEARKLIQQAKLNKNKLKAEEQLVKQQLKAEEQLVKQQLKAEEQYFKLSKSKSSLNKLKLKEKIDPEILKYLIASPFLQTQKYETALGDVYENEKDFLIKYQQKIINDTAIIEYKQPKHKYARVYVDNSLTLGCMRGIVRDTLTEDFYTDIDIDNCHCAIIEQILNKVGRKCQSLTTYNNDRSNILNEVMTYYKCDRKTAKSYFLICLYGGDYKTFTNQHNKREGVNKIEDDKKPLKFMTDYYNDIQTITDLIYTHNMEMTQEIKQFKDEYKTQYTDRSIKNSILSYYAQDYERRILEIIFNYLKENNIIEDTAILIYDGLQIPKEKYNDNLLIELSKEIKSKIGFELSLSRKPAEKSIKKELLEWAKDNFKSYEIPEKYIGSIDPIYFNTLSNGDKKTYFENFVCKIMTPEIFYVYDTIDNKGSMHSTFYTDKNLFSAFKNLKIDINGETEDFINYWVSLDNMKQYIKMSFEPDNIEDPNLYNLFKGFNKDIINHKIKDIDKTNKLMSLFDDIILNLVGGVEKYKTYFKAFIADIFQNPSDRKPISILIKSLEGVGKNTVLDAYGKLLNNLYITSANSDDFFSNHAEGFNNKLLINMNEVELTKTKDIQNKIKSFVSEDSITINPKSIRPYSVRNLARMIYTTNKDISTVIDAKAKDRRNVIFEATKKYTDPKLKTLWTKAREQFKTKDFLKALYNDIMNTDLSKTDLMQRPITELYIETFKYFLPTEIQFLTEYTNTRIYNLNKLKKSSYKKGEIRELEGKTLYNMYLSFLEENNFKNQLDTDIRKFYNKIYSLHFENIVIKDSRIKLFFIDTDKLSNEIRDKYNSFNDDIIETVEQTDLLDQYGLN